MLEIYRTRPILAWSVTAIVGLFLLWLIWPRGSSSASGSTAGYSVYNPNSQSDAAIAANATVQAATIQASAANAAQERAATVELARLAVSEKLGELGYQNDAARNLQNFNLGTQAIAANLQSESVQVAAEKYLASLNAGIAARQIDQNAQTYNLLIKSQVTTSAIDKGVSRGSLDMILGRLGYVAPPPLPTPTN